MTKEEYINNCLPLRDDEYWDLASGVDIAWIKKNSLPKAFADFAKQEAIEFFKWHDDYKHGVIGDDSYYENLYKKFIQSKETNNG